MRQKCGSERLVPFETIDTSIYKANSNCTCFLTSEKRVHAWIQALAETLYIDLGSDPKYVVAWRDVRNDKSIMIQTEFIVIVIITAHHQIQTMIFYIKLWYTLQQGRS